MGDDNLDSDGEAVGSTLGDKHPGFADRIHPGYVGDRQLLDSICPMARDGLCLYHCMAAARDYAGYIAAGEAERTKRAIELRLATIARLNEEGLFTSMAA